MNDFILYECEICGNTVLMVRDSGVRPVCCGEEMKPVEANTVEASIEKHVPVILRNCGLAQVQVGSTQHPSTEAHHIECIALETNRGVHASFLNPGETPEAFFELIPGETVKAAYALCNLHGLWKKHP